MVNSQKTEDISGANAASGVPGTPSNLPRPTSRPGSGGNSVTRRTENIAYQSSRMVRKVRLPQGAVKRMSVSILVDNVVHFEGAGPKAKRIFEPPPPERMKAIHDLVAGVIGFSAERGDQLVIEAQPFEATRNIEPPAINTPTPPPPSDVPVWLQNAFKNKVLLIGATAGAVFLVMLAGAAGFILSRRKKQAKPVETPAQIEAAARSLAAQAAEDISKKLQGQLDEQAATRERQQMEAMNTLKLPQVTTKKAEVLTRHIHEEAKKDPKAMAQLLRTWLNEKDQMK